MASAEAKTQPTIWIFGYGSLIWGTGPVQVTEKRTGILTGWHREWTWISTAARPGAPTCSLAPGGQVKGVFLKLRSKSTKQDLDIFRQRERAATEEMVSELPEPGATTYFWTMGDNLSRYPEFNGLTGQKLARALAEKAAQISSPGTDGVLPSDYIRQVHQFDPEDHITSEIFHFLPDLSTNISNCGAH